MMDTLGEMAVVSRQLHFIHRWLPEDSNWAAAQLDQMKEWCKIIISQRLYEQLKQYEGEIVTQENKDAIIETTTGVMLAVRKELGFSAEVYMPTLCDERI